MLLGKRTKQRTIQRRARKLKNIMGKYWWEKYNGEYHLIQHQDIQPILNQLTEDIASVVNKLKSTNYVVEYNTEYRKHKNRDENIRYKKVNRNAMAYYEYFEEIQAIMSEMKRVGKIIEFPEK